MLQIEACGQSKNKSFNGLKDRREYIANKLNSFESEPMYRLKIKSHLTYEVLLNDIPVAIRFSQNMGTIGIL